MPSPRAKIWAVFMIEVRRKINWACALLSAWSNAPSVNRTISRFIQYSLVITWNDGHSQYIALNDCNSPSGVSIIGHCLHYRVEDGQFSRGWGPNLKHKAWKPQQIFIHAIYNSGCNYCRMTQQQTQATRASDWGTSSTSASGAFRRHSIHPENVAQTQSCQKWLRHLEHALNGKFTMPMPQISYNNASRSAAIVRQYYRRL